MLLRVYRFTDKFSLLLLKGLAALSARTADGVMLILGSPAADQRRGLLGILALILGAIFAILSAVFGVLWTVIAAVAGTVGGLMGFAVTRAAGGTTQAARSGVGGVMARRAARTEIQGQIAEDPLRVQNRMLSALVVIALAGLIVAVLWATGQQQTQPGIPVAGALNPIADPLLLSTPDADPGTGGEAPGVIAPVALATQIPTATQVPEVLQASGSIAFTVRENGQNDLWAVGVNNRRPIRITNDDGDERDPAWSPDGTHLAYASNKDGNWDIYIYDLTSGSTERMTVGLSFQARPSWSNDGNWLVYETYEGGSLDIHVLPVTDLQASNAPITNSPEPNFSPAWSPGGREIAFSSWRDGAQDIFVVSLDDISTLTNLTNTVGRHEDYASWHPDGDLIAYSALDEGIEKVFVKSVRDPNAPAELIGVGRTPTWLDSGAIIATVDTIDATHMIVYPYGSTGAIPQVIAVPPNATMPTWTAQPLPASLINAGGLPLTASPLYTEQTVRDEVPPFFGLSGLNSVDAPLPQLSDQVNDSFNALRERVLQVSGRDFMGRLDDAFWLIDHPVQPGEARENWHKTGRAFSVNRAAAVVGFPPLLQVVREDRGVNTFWRLYLRVDEQAQSGQLGEPLRHMPWDFGARTSGDAVAYEQGGKLREEMPQGYFIDLTQLAADYGWQPFPAGSTWRLNSNAINYWMFYKPGTLSWLDAMLEVYTVSQLGVYAPTATPAPAPPESDNSDGDAQAGEGA